MKTFEQMIGQTGEKALETRVKNVIRNTSAASRTAVENLKQQFRDLQSKLYDHMDLGVKDTTSLVVEMKNPSEWVEVLNKSILDMHILARKIEIAVNVHNQLFPTNQVEGLDEDDLEFISKVSSSEVMADEVED